MAQTLMQSLSEEAVYLLANESATKPDTLHADTQGQFFPVFGLAHPLASISSPASRTSSTKYGRGTTNRGYRWIARASDSCTGTAQPTHDNLILDTRCCP
ncbi:hypothetical protein EST92_20655 [Streptomyces sp. TM32]|nr:hypothetical protein EST92_20655 [Streptomyces sp. TM32]